MAAAHLPRGKLYTLAFPAGWWIDITATETITALQNLTSTPWPTTEGHLDEALTLAHLTSDDRVITTAIATTLREGVTLDDGTLPLGITFLSKHGHPAQGTGTCWAYWIRYLDSRLTEPTKITQTKSIQADDQDLMTVQTYCKTKSR